MNMPGFKAEASLYKTEATYSSAVTFGYADAGVYPADRYARCVSRCIRYNEPNARTQDDLRRIYDFCSQHCRYALPAPRPPVIS